MWENQLNSECSKSKCGRCRMRQQSTANIVLQCFICGPHLPVRPWDEYKTPQDFRQGTGQVWSQRICCLGPRKRMKCFLATVGGHQRAENRQYFSPAFTTAPSTTYSISPTLSPSLFWPQTVRLFIFTTRPIYKTASWWVLLQKRRPSLWSSSRSLAERLSLQLSVAQHPTAALHLQAWATHFLSHSHVLRHVTSPLCPLTSYPTRELAFMQAQIPQLQHNSGKINCK